MEIKTKNISLKIGAKEIIKDIEFKVNKKQFVGLIGANGSGKSSLLKCIIQNNNYDGDVYYNEELANKIKVKDRAKLISVVSQHNYYNFDFSVEEIVLMGRSPYKKNLESDTLEDYEIVEDCLKKVEMYSFKDRNFNTLSGGEQQRIILARALAQQTPCIILDEPTNHLDIKHQLQLFEIIKSLECTVISAIHDINFAMKYCDYIYALKDGEIYAQGTIEQVITSENIKVLFDVNSVIDYKNQSISFTL